MLLQREIRGHSRPHSPATIPDSCQECLPVPDSLLRSDLAAFCKSEVKGLSTIISISTHMDSSFNLGRCQLLAEPRLPWRRLLPEQLADERPSGHAFRCRLFSGSSERKTQYRVNRHIRYCFFGGAHRFSGANEYGGETEAVGRDEVVAGVVADHRQGCGGEIELADRLAEIGKRRFADDGGADSSGHFEGADERTAVELHAFGCFPGDVPVHGDELRPIEEQTVGMVKTSVGHLVLR